MYSKRYCILLAAIVFLFNSTNSKKSYFGSSSQSFFPNRIKIKSLECYELDPTYAKFTKCIIEDFNKTMRLVSVTSVLLKPPLKKSTISFRLFKYDNGYHPFVFDFTLDMCKFLAGRKHHLYKWMFELALPYTNVNHTCPYNHDLILNKYPFDKMAVPSLIIKGDYRFDFNVSGDGVPRVSIKTFVAVVKG